ncbi:hypothetical protein PoB_001944400 [Plakobranchus ocellatus]|uniref:Probable RNA-binding protein 18 n=1 Tax=Plakobranchus ocellatus TaxID=259542 RepID=A0AAV3ZC20_9GAST|nr:hypothetical protein PoB_001944400 [Plakobranchus ocellatus]
MTEKISNNSFTQGSIMNIPDDPFGENEDDKRLWIGNLDSNMTEFAILKLVQKFGSIRKMDFIYHKAGPDKGKSKGYCFVSFHEWKTAEKARKTLDGKFLLGRPMYVKWARSSKERDEYLKVDVKTPCGPIDAAEATASLALASSSSATAKSYDSTKVKKKASSPSGAAESNLGLSSGELERASTSAKIQAIEAKLRLMEQTQKDFGVDATIKAPPGFVPLSTSQGNQSRRGHSSRPAPYRRSHQNTPRPRQRRR